MLPPIALLLALVGGLGTTRKRPSDTPSPRSDRAYLARRAAVLSILTASGVSEELAELLVRQWEAGAEARGIRRLERTFWEGAVEWTGERAWPNMARASPPQGVG